jgi:ABC-2 type transport system permease protein
MASGKRSGQYFKFIIYLVIVALVNLAGITLFFRADLTANKIYSISDASQKVVATLSEPLTIKVFFTKDLPPPYNNTERYLHDLFEEYAISGNKFFNYRFYDVSAEEGELTDKAQENQKIASNYGIQPIQIQVVDKDEVKFQKAYMGLALIHGDLIERVPAVTSTEGLEYQLTTAIQKMNNKISALLSLPGKIKIKLFLSSSLETVAPHMGVRNLANMPAEIENIVKKLNQKNYNKLEFEFLNPTRDQDLTALSKKYNIMMLSWPALAKGQLPPGKGVIGLVMDYGENQLAVPLMQVIRLPLIGTQYQLTETAALEESINNNVEGLIDINEDIGYLADHGTLNLAGTPPGAPGRPPAEEPATNFRRLVSQNYSLKNIRLKEENIPESLNSLIIARPTEKFSDYELFQIDQFLMQGKSLALVLNRFNEMSPGGQQGMNLGQGPVYIPLDTGLEKLLSHYGIRIQQSFVMDQNCYRQELPAQFGGGERAIYFAPLIKDRFINDDLDFMKNIKRLVALKISPLELDSERISQNSLQTHKLFASSEKSWQMRDRINLNPMFIKPPESSDDMQSYPLAYIIEGEFPSYFSGKSLPLKEIKDEKDAGDKPPTETAKSPTDDIDLSQIEHKGQFLARGKPGKIFVMASADMLKDNVLDAGGRGSNATFILNTIDYLNGREDIAVMRAKVQRFNPVKDTQAAVKTFVKASNIVGLPVLVVIFGFGVWFRRHSRKKQIQMMFHR